MLISIKQKLNRHKESQNIKIKKMPVILSKIFDYCKIVNDAACAYFCEMYEIIVNPPRTNNIGYLKASKKRYKAAPWWYKTINEILVVSSWCFVIYKYGNKQLPNICKYFGTGHNIPSHRYPSNNLIDYRVDIKFMNNAMIVNKYDFITMSTIFCLPIMFNQYAPVLVPLIIMGYNYNEPSKIIEISARCANLNGCDWKHKCIKSLE